jgi:SAM-dependent methyltransferase
VAEGPSAYIGAVSFDVAPERYDRFMGRYSVLLSPQMADLAGIQAGQRVIDVGCGPGVLTSELVQRVGADRVAAVDPSPPFVEATRARHPGVDVRQASAELLPFPDREFDAALAQLVVHFMADPIVGLTEMTRVTRPGGVVAACVWDHAGGKGPLGLFWDTARELDPGIEDESNLPGTREGHLVELFEAVGLRKVEGTALSVSREHSSFEDWWTPFISGAGPAGAYVSGLTDDRRTELREGCRRHLPSGPFVLTAVAWAARGLA